MLPVSAVIRRLPSSLSVSVITHFIRMSINPYVTQICEQTGMNEWEVQSSLPRTRPTLQYVQKMGFHTIEDYLDDLHDFLNGL